LLEAKESGHKVKIMHLNVFSMNILGYPEHPITTSLGGKIPFSQLNSTREHIFDTDLEIDISIQ
jgi:hypothetical protein